RHCSQRGQRSQRQRRQRNTPRIDRCTRGRRMTYVIAVRALCEFTAKRGDLDLRFTPAPTAAQGIEGHATVAARRASGYEKELALSGTYRDLTVRGRADGYDAALNRLDEIKTYRGDLERMPDNHRA